MMSSKRFHYDCNQQIMFTIACLNKEVINSQGHEISHQEISFVVISFAVENGDSIIYYHAYSDIRVVIHLERFLMHVQ